MWDGGSAISWWTECMHNMQPFCEELQWDRGEAGWERKVGVRSHHTGGKTSSAILPRITSPGVAAARPKHPLPGPNTATLFPTHLVCRGKFSCKNVQIIMSVCYLLGCLHTVHEIEEQKRKSCVHDMCVCCCGGLRSHLSQPLWDISCVNFE